MDSLSSQSKEHAFWQWFQANEPLLLAHSHTESNREQVLDAVHEALKAVDENLAFAFGPIAEPREFIVSAGGIEDSFPAVLRLRETQPKLEHWELIYFRPRGELVGTIRMGEISVTSRDLQFSLLSRETEIGLEVFIPGYDDSDGRFKQIGYLFLDQALGEFDVTTKITYLRFFPLTEPEKFDRFPFAELPESFDELYNRLKGLSGEPC